MKRLPLWIIALIITAAPVVTDVCRLDCALDRPPECPLHQQGPHTCTHDHTIGAAGLTRASVETSRPTDITIAVTSYRITLAPASADMFRVEHQHAPPLRSPRPNVLRI